MRTRINPIKVLDKKKKFSDVFKPKEVTICLLTYIPNDIGYFKDRLKILKITLESLINNTDRNKYNLIVLNNGKNHKAKYLLDNYFKRKHIDQLIHTNKNLGVINALNFLFKSATGKYVCWIPDDVFFEKNWLNKSLNILKNFPKIGFVSCTPCRSSFNKKNFENCRKNFKEFNACKLNWDDNWDKIYSKSVGLSYKDFIKLNPKEISVGYKKNNTIVMPLASHFITVMHNKTLNKILPFPKVYKGTGGSKSKKNSLINIFDNKLVNLGYSNVTTQGCYAIHIGNFIDEIIQKKYNAMKSKATINHLEIKTKKFSFFEIILIKIFKLPFLRKLPRYLVTIFENILLLKSKYDAEK